MVRRICLIGVKGSGKTYLVKSILDRIPHINYFVGSQILRQLVGDEFSHFDTFPEERKSYFRTKAIEFMISEQNRNKKPILIDGHTTLYNPNTSKVDNVFTESDCSFYNEFIVLSIDKTILLQRRKNDTTKKRILDENIIDEEMRIELSNCQDIASKYGQKIHFLPIDDGKHESFLNIQNKLLSILNED